MNLENPKPWHSEEHVCLVCSDRYLGQANNGFCSDSCEKAHYDDRHMDGPDDGGEE